MNPVHQISSKSRLNADEGETIPLEFYRKLVESMPRRLEAVYVNKGYQTKYKIVFK